MNPDAHRLADYLGHMLVAIERIQQYCTDIDGATFLANAMLQDAVIRNFEIIREASKNIARKFPDFQKARPEPPLIDAYEMRNALAHGYFKVDLEILWNTIQKDLPGLYVQIRNLRL